MREDTEQEGRDAIRAGEGIEPYIAYIFLVSGAGPGLSM